MTSVPQRHNRRSIRPKGYDYSRAGAYFVTLCTCNRECILGEVVEGTMYLNEPGEIALAQWLRAEIVRSNVLLDHFVIMPNHIHGIVIINDLHRGDPPGRPYLRNRSSGPSCGSIGAIIGQFKSAVTKQINYMRKTRGSRVWQRNYYEHVIRDEDELDRLRRYIIDNPAQWEKDEDNPYRQVEVCTAK